MTRVFLPFVLVALTACVSLASGLNILGISTLASPSHHVWFQALMNGLAQKGHRVYALGLLETKFDKDRVKENQTTSIELEGFFETLGKKEGFNALQWSQMTPIEFGQMVYDVSHEFCEIQMASEGAKQALELVKNIKFDVIVQDMMAGQCFFGLWDIAQGNPPVVGYTPLGQACWVKDIVGGSNWPAIKPYPFYDHMAPFTLWDKILNLYYYEMDNIRRQYHYNPIQQELAEKFIGKKLSKSVDEMEKNVNVMLINSYAALEPATFWPPNAVEVGALHVTDPKPLPKEIKAFLDGAEHGAVVMSFGTNVKTNNLKPEALKAIISVLGKLKQRVLWKFDTDDLVDKPDNLMIKKWIPQGDVLAHPKVRALWAHGGLLSTQEAVWRGVPVVAMPFFMDQKSNVDLLIKKGVALHLDFESLTPESISEALDRILDDPSFAQRMKQLSQEYRDRPMSPMDLAVWHVEHAARHPRGPLASPGRDLSRVQLNLLDVYAVLGVAVLSISWIFFLLLRALFNLFRSQQKTKTA